MQLPSSHHHRLINSFSCFLLWELLILFFRGWWSGWGNLTFWKWWFRRSKLISQLRRAEILFSATKEYKDQALGVTEREDGISSYFLLVFQVLPCLRKHHVLIPSFKFWTTWVSFVLRLLATCLCWLAG